MAARTRARKLIDAHLVEGDPEPGEEIGLRVDQTLTQDATGTMVMQELAALGLERARTEVSVQYIDQGANHSRFRPALRRHEVDSVFGQSLPTLVMLAADRVVGTRTNENGTGFAPPNWAELETAVRERLPVMTIVLDNGILGYQKHAELHQFGAHTSAIPINPVDHTMIARACGSEAVRVAEPDAVPPITQWDDSSALDVLAVG